MSSDDAPQYFFNTQTGQVEVGRSSPWDQRMGPYVTRAEAEQALRTAQSRTEAWDEEDEQRRRERQQ